MLWAKYSKGVASPVTSSPHFPLKQETQAFSQERLEGAELEKSEFEFLHYFPAV